MKFNCNIPICFQDYFTSQSCDNVKPKSGLYIETLEGISVQKAAAFADAKYKTGKALIEEKSVLAFQLFEMKLLSMLQAQNIKINALPEITSGCAFQSGSNAAFAAERGICVMRNYKDSPLSAIFVEQVQLKAMNAVGNVTARITDEYFNTIHSFTGLNFQAGETLILDVQKRITNRKFYVLWDNSNIVTAKSTCGDSGSCCTALAKDRRNNYVSVRGWDGDQQTSEGFGASICMRLDCSTESLLCKLLDHFKLPLLYQIGIEILKEGLNSDRLNFVTIYGADAAQSKIFEWEYKVDELTATILNNLAPGLTKLDKFCLKCCPAVRQVIMLP